MGRTIALLACLRNRAATWNTSHRQRPDVRSRGQWLVFGTPSIHLLRDVNISRRRGLSRGWPVRELRTLGGYGRVECLARGLASVTRDDSMCGEPKWPCTRRLAGVAMAVSRRGVVEEPVHILAEEAPVAACAEAISWKQALLLPAPHRVRVDAEVPGCLGGRQHS